MYLAILQTKLNNIDRACEEAARTEIDHFYKNIRYDESRFIYPSFQEVASVWLRLIREKEKNLISETKNILDAMTVIDEVHLTKINSIAEMFFSEVQYIDRLKGFSEGVARRAASYGQVFNPDIGRLDLADAAYRAQVQGITELGSDPNSAGHRCQPCCASGGIRSLKQKGLQPLCSKPQKLLK